MSNSIRTLLRTLVRTIFAPVLVAFPLHDWEDTRNFIPYKSTLAKAEERNMSVGDYVDTVLNGIPGLSQSTIDLMSSAGVFSETLDTIVEIGPGTGRYLEKTIKIAQPRRYEIYDTAGPWLSFLKDRYDVVAQPTDGFSLSHTPDGSVDLVHAHKVFSGTPFMMTDCYWHEMARVLAPGGWAVFDILTEACLQGDTLTLWAKSGIRNGAFPAVVPRQLAIKFFESRNFSLKASFIVPMPPGTTELMIFRRNKHEESA